MIFATKDDQIVGAVEVLTIAEEIGAFRMLCVKKEYRSHKVGRALVDAAE